MKSMRKKRGVMFLGVLCVSVLFSTVITLKLVSYANDRTVITYQFTGKEASRAGYAEGTLKLYAKKAGTYYLYWADDTKALDGYYAIGDIDDTTSNDSNNDIIKKQAYFHDMSAGESRTFQFGEHTAIPAGATKIIATTSKTALLVRDAEAVFPIPESKQLQSGAGKLFYTFNSYADVHIDTEGYYQKSISNWEKALKYAAHKNTDFIISAGDAITNSKGASGSKGGFADEWDTYEKILAASDYCNPVYEADGNHDMRTEEKGKMGSGAAYKGITAYVQESGTDSTVENVKKNKPYYYVIEKTSGDVFIFMALENGSDPGNYNNFSKEQMKWLKNLLDTYYGTGVNVYIIEHSPFRGYGAGDVWQSPRSNGYIPSHYKSLMLVNGQVGKDDSNNYFTASGMDQNTEFKQLLETYPNLIWMNGHTHQDFTVSINYSNENDTSCHMIHNPAVAGTTYFKDANSESQEYNSSASSSDGCGRTSQGYYVEAYENAVVYYGANLYDEKIYPAYCYIMEGSRKSASVATTERGQAVTPKYETFFTDKEIISPDADLSSALTVAKNLLDTYYSLASYDQYQALKKCYYTYRNNTVLSDTSCGVANLKEAAERFYAVAEQLGKVSGDSSTGSTSADYYLVYYVENKHAWTTNDCKLTKDFNGNLSYTYEATGEENVSFKVYNADTKKYYAVSQSVELVWPFSSETYFLSEFSSYSSSCGARSITLKGMSAGTKITFTFNPSLHAITAAGVPTPTVTPDASSAPTATPTVTPDASSAPTATPTVTPEVTGVPTATPTITPDMTSVPTTTPTVPAKTPTVTPTETANVTPEVTATASIPTKIPETTTPTPSQTPETTAPASTKVPENTPTATATAKPAKNNIKKGSVVSHTASNGKYRVMTIKKAADKDGTVGTVAYLAMINKNKTSVTIPARITIKKQKFKVTVIAKSAFAGNRKLKKVVIGKNIKKIGANAYKGCKNLSRITIQTTGLTKISIGKNAFQKISGKAIIQVPKSRWKKYKKWIKAAGAGKAIVFKRV